MIEEGGLGGIGFHLLEVGADDDGLNLVQAGDPRILAPVQELKDGPLIGRARVGIADAGGEEVDEAPAGFLGGGLEDGGEPVLDPL